MESLTPELIHQISSYLTPVKCLELRHRSFTARSRELGQMTYADISHLPEMRKDKSLPYFYQFVLALYDILSSLCGSTNMTDMKQLSLQFRNGHRTFTAYFTVGREHLRFGHRAPRTCPRAQPLIACRFDESPYIFFGTSSDLDDKLHLDWYHEGMRTGVEQNSLEYLLHMRLGSGWKDQRRTRATLSFGALEEEALVCDLVEISERPLLLTCRFFCSNLKLAQMTTLT